MKDVQEEFNFPIKLWKEGEVLFFAPDQSIYEKKDYPPSKFPVFYNPMMTINRDLTLLLLKTWMQKFPNKQLKFGEPLCGIGIRGLRILKEIGNVNVFVNDINEISLQMLRKSLVLNAIKEEDLIISHDDANQFMSNHSKHHERFDILDIDPFGSPVRFIDPAFRALKGENGLLCATATDMPPLVGIYKKACFRKYGLMPIKTEYSHELALRILITFLIREGAKLNLGVKVIFSYYHQHHVRSFVSTSLGKTNADKSLSKLGYIHHCFNCNERLTTKIKRKKIITCPSCDLELESIGPIFIGKLASDELLTDMNENIEYFKFNNIKKIKKFMNLIIDEKDAPVTFHDISRLIYEHHLKSKKLIDIIEALKNEGFHASRTHFSPMGIKTNAKRNDIARIIKTV
ncbi:MAG: tRNA (guanine(10)-N(2))-dimethyltransferase [Candidatus Helarchaeota archaeon]